MPKTQQTCCPLKDGVQKLDGDGLCGTTNVWCVVLVSLSSPLSLVWISLFLAVVNATGI